MVAKEGKGVLTSEKRRESAETEYHRLLCEESMHQVRQEREFGRTDGGAKMLLCDACFSYLPRDHELKYYCGELLRCQTHDND